MLFNYSDKKSFSELPYLINWSPGDSDPSHGQRQDQEDCSGPLAGRESKANVLDVQVIFELCSVFEHYSSNQFIISVRFPIILCRCTDV